MKHPSSEFIHGLRSNPWVISIRSALENSDTPLEIGLSPAGHDRLRDIGLDAFIQRLGEEISIKAGEMPQLSFYPVNSLPEFFGAFDDAATFPRLLSALVEPDCYRLLLFVDGQMDWFKGHFPGSPVLPGVVQLHWAARIADTLFKLNDLPRTVSRLKFQNVVVPPRIIELEMGRLDRERIQFRFQSLGITHSSGVLRFGGIEQC